MVTPILKDLISEAEFIIFGAGPVGLATAQYLKLQNKKFVIFSLPDHFGIENELGYGINLGSDKKMVGGIGGTARNWGGQCGYFSETDYKNWEKLELGGFSKNKFEAAINECSNYLKITKPKKDISLINHSLSNVSTVYPKQKDLRKIFKNLLSSVEILHISKIKKYVESDSDHIIILEDDQIIEIEKNKKIIFALGGLCNLKLYKNSDFLFHDKNTPIAVYDHLSFYPIDFKSKKNPFEFSTRIKNGGKKLNKKIYLAEKSSSTNMVQQGVAEVHPVYSWDGQKKFDKFANLIKRVLNFIIYNLGLKNYFLPGRYRIFMQIEQNYELQRYSELTQFNGLKVSKQDYKFINYFIDELSKFLEQNEFKVIKKAYIEDLSSPTLFQAFHPSSVFLYPEKGYGPPRINFLGLPFGAKNIHFVGSCMFPTPGWVNPTLMAMSHAVYVTQECISE